MRQAKLSALWFLMAAILAPLAWGFFGTLQGAVFLQSSEALVSRFLFGWFFGAAWGAAVVGMFFSIPYFVALIAWPALVRLLPRVEATQGGLAVATAALALPAALAVGFSYAEFAGSLRLRELAQTFPCALLSGWLALLAPRLVIRSLAPGAFSRGSTAAA